MYTATGNKETHVSVKHVHVVHTYVQNSMRLNVG
jgi:hypothetical protein